MTQQRQIAVIGAGRMGRIRALACRALGFPVQAVVDPNPEVGQPLADEVDAAFYRDANHLDLSRLDALFICTPPVHRGPLELAAAELGVALFLEKPAALNAAQLAPLQQRVAQRGVHTAVGYMNRYRTGVQAAAARIAQQEVIGFNAHWVNGIYKVPWWRQPGQSGGSVNEQATHFVDLARLLIGEPIQVQATAQTHPEHPQIVGSASLNFTFHNDVVGSFFYSCQADYKSMAFRLLTTREAFCFEGWDLTPSSPEPLRAEPPSDRNQIFQQETHCFLQAVAQDNPSLIRCTLAEALRTQRVMDAVDRALQSGQAISLQEPQPV